MSLISGMFINSRPLSQPCVFLALILVPLSGFSDHIILTNGRSIDGLIVKETATALVLDIGGGTTTIASNKIARVQRSNEKGNEQVMSQWKEQDFLHKRNVPEGMKDLAAEFRTLLDARAEAVRMQQSSATFEGQETALLAEIDNVSRSLAEASKRIADAKQTQGAGVDAYNALVAEANSAGAQLNIKSRELDDVRNTRKAGQGQIASYVQSLFAFGQSFVERGPLLQKQFDTDETSAFLQKVSAKLRELNLEFQSASIQTDLLQNGNRLISAVINGKVTGRFILDTGAATVSLSKSFAERLNLDTSVAKTIEVTLADGSNVKADALILDSVQAGDARAEKVDAVVMPTSIGEGVDGLLGMSFLRNFFVQFDGTHGNLTLRRFSPK